LEIKCLFLVDMVDLVLRDETSMTLVFLIWTRGNGDPSSARVNTQIHEAGTKALQSKTMFTS